MLPVHGGALWAEKSWTEIKQRRASVKWKACAACSMSLLDFICNPALPAVILIELYWILLEIFNLFSFPTRFLCVHPLLPTSKDCQMPTLFFSYFLIDLMLLSDITKNIQIVIYTFEYWCGRHRSTADKHCYLPAPGLKCSWGYHYHHSTSMHQVLVLGLVLVLVLLVNHLKTSLLVYRLDPCHYITIYVCTFPTH